jgi:hypothetical protein
VVGGATTSVASAIAVPSVTSVFSCPPQAPNNLIMERFEGVVGELDRAPILNGSLGRRSVYPVAHGPRSWRRRGGEQLGDKAVGFTFEQWHYAFTNTFGEEQGRALYERCHIPASGQITGRARWQTSIPARTTPTSTTSILLGRRCCLSREATTT